MIDTPSLEWWSVAPEAVTAIAGLVALLAGLAGSKMVTRQLLPVLSLASLAVAMGLAISQFDHAWIGSFADQVDADQLADMGRFISIGAAMVAVVLAWRGNVAYTNGRSGEFHSLILFSVCGMGLFSTAASLPAMFVGLELFSIALYALCAMEPERSESLEGGLKYLIVGGVGSAMFIYGAALVYGATGTFDISSISEQTNGGTLLYAGLAFLVVALGLKASAAPLHWWAPDAYEGAATPVTTFMAVATKAVAFVALVRLLVVGFVDHAEAWEAVIALLVIASVVIGNLGALAQTRVKRMLAYSSVAHAGYLLLGVLAWQHDGVSTLMYALVVYSVMTIGAFSLVAFHEARAGRVALTFDDLAGQGWGTWRVSLPAAALSLCMLSLVGFPPTAGFVAKLSLFAAVVDAGHPGLAIVAVLGSVVSVAYYMRVPMALYFKRPVEESRSVELNVSGETERSATAGATGVAVSASATLQPQHTFASAATIGCMAAVLTLALAFPPTSLWRTTCDAQDSVLIQVGGKDCRI